MENKSNVLRNVVIVVVVLVLGLYVFGKKGAVGGVSDDGNSATTTPAQGVDVLGGARVNPLNGADRELNPFK